MALRAGRLAVPEPAVSLIPAVIPAKAGIQGARIEKAPLCGASWTPRVPACAGTTMHQYRWIVCPPSRYSVITVMLRAGMTRAGAAPITRVS